MASEKMKRMRLNWGCWLERARAVARGGIIWTISHANVALEAIFGAAIETANLVFDDCAYKYEQDEAAQADGEEDEVMGEQAKDDQANEQCDDGEKRGEAPDDPANPATRLILVLRWRRGRRGRWTRIGG